MSKTHQPAEMVMVTSVTIPSRSRRQNFVGEAIINARAIPGRMSITCNCFVKNPKPTATPARAIHPVRRRLPKRVVSCSRARKVAATAATSRKTSKASGLLKRNIKAATGVVIKITEAKMPVQLPQYLRVTL